MTDVAFSSLVIRDAETSDWPIIVEYNRALAAESEGKILNPDTLVPGVQTLLADQRHGRYFLAERGGEPVGQLMLTYEWSDWRNGQIWWLQSVYVVPAARGAGVFRALFDHVQRLAATAGAVGLRLYVEENNRRAQDVYARLEMQPAGYLVLEKLWR